MATDHDPCRALADALADVVRQAVAEALGGVMPTRDESALVGIGEASRRLGLGGTTVKREIAAGRLRSVLVGRRRLIPVDAIADYTARLAQPS